MAESQAFTGETTESQHISESPPGGMKGKIEPSIFKVRDGFFFFKSMKLKVFHGVYAFLKGNTGQTVDVPKRYWSLTQAQFKRERGESIESNLRYNRYLSYEPQENERES